MTTFKHSSTNGFYKTLGKRVKEIISAESKFAPLCDTHIASVITSEGTPCTKYNVETARKFYNIPNKISRRIMPAKKVNNNGNGRIQFDLPDVSVTPIDEALHRLVKIENEVSAIKHILNQLR